MIKVSIFNNETDTYVLSASSRANRTTKFIIDGVTELHTISMSTTYATASYISSSGPITASGFYTDGDISMSGNLYGGIEGDFPEGMLRVESSISTSGDIHLDNLQYIKYNSTSEFSE